MKEAYFEPEMTVTPFSAMDIITCSNGDDVLEETTAAWTPQYNENEPPGTGPGFMPD